MWTYCGRAIACNIHHAAGGGYLAAAWRIIVQAAVEKEAKGLPLGKTYTECLMKSSGKFKLAAGCGMSAVFAVFSRFYRDGW